MEAPDRLALLWGSSFFAGALAQLASQRSGLPVVVLLLAIGLLTGEAGLGLIHPSRLGRGLEPLVGLLVCLVLFDGGLNLRLVGRTLQRSLLQLVLVRSVLGFAAAAALAHSLAGLAWPLSLVFAAISLATGPTVVTSLVRQMRLTPYLAQLLEAEGLILEPVAAVLALLLLELALGELGRWQEVARQLLLHLGAGVLIGALSGWLLALLLDGLTASATPPPGPLSAAPVTASPQTTAVVADEDAMERAAASPPCTGAEMTTARAVSSGAEPGAMPLPEAIGASGLQLQLTLGVLFLLFSSCEALLPQSGLPAAVSAGVVVGLRIERTATLLDELIAQLALLAITVLFPLLAADVSWRELLLLGGGGLLCVLALTPARWVVLQVAGLGLPLGSPEKLLLSWVAPRGIVTAAVASLFALRLEEAGVAGAGELKGLVFLMILITVGLQGATAPWLARRLGLSDPLPAPLATSAPLPTDER